MTELYLGVGLSSGATVDEVRELVASVLRAAGADPGEVVVVATRARFVESDDTRLRLGPPVVGVDDDTLLERFPNATATTGRFPARVAEGCALTAAGEGSRLVVPTTRSAGATAALAARGRQAAEAGR